MLRLGINILMVFSEDEGKLVKVTGKVDKVDQNVSMCIVFVGKFYGKFMEKCQFRVGDRVEIVGKVNVGLIDGVMGRIWLDKAAIGLVFSGGVGEGVLFNNWRGEMVSVLRRIMPIKEAALVGGIVLGDKSGIDREFYEAMIRSGTVHIIVASGYNVMIVGGTVLSVLLYFLKRKWASFGAVGVMVFYAFLAGGEPPVLRAVVMGGVIFLGSVLGRRSIAWWSLLLTSWLMVMVEVSLLESVSFQLTVAATFGLLVVEPKIRRWLEDREGWWVRSLLRSEFLPTLSASVATFPIIFWHFGRVGWWGLLTNLLVLPLVPVVMLLGGISLVLGLVWLPLGQVVGWGAYGLAHLVAVIVEMF
jgi:competence protein ComEC